MLARPSWATGFAREDGEAEYPDLFRGLAFAWCPSFGYDDNRVKGVFQGTPDITLVGDPTWSVQDPPNALGPGGHAPSYNGTSHAGQTARAIDLTGANRLTIAFWLWWDSFGADDDLCLESSTNFNLNAGGVLGDPGESTFNDFAFAIRNSAATGNCHNSFARPSAAAWHHYLVTMDLAAWSVATHQVWVDGVAQTLTNRSASGTAPANFGNYVWYFMSRSASGLFGDGRLSDFFVWPQRLLGQPEAVAMHRGRHPLQARPRRVTKAPAAGNVFTATAALTAGRATASGSATFAAGTKTGTAALTAKGATAAGSATHVAPTYTGSAAVSAGPATAAGSATFAAGTKTATATLTTGAATAAGSATFAAGTKTATAALTVGRATLTAAATFAAGTKTATATLTTGRATASGSATFTAPVYTGSAGLTVGRATCAGTGLFATVVFQASAALVAGGADLAGSAEFDAPVYTASGALAVGRATLAGSATFTAPVYTGTAALAVGRATASGSATFTAPAFTAAATLTVGRATLSALATFVGDAVSLVPGGAFRRALPTWARVIARRAGTWGRTFERAVPTWGRVWRYDPMALPTETGPALIAAASDDREYAFDCRLAPELAAGSGITISSGEILGGSGLTFGAPAVLAAAFDGIPSGKGLSVRASGGSAGTTYKLACRVTLSNGRKFVVPGRLSKVADYDA